MRRDLVVVGASAGGVEALRQLVAGLPKDLPAAVVVVLHMPAGGTSALPAILSRSGPLPALLAEDGAGLRNAHLHIARPDHHVVVEDGVLRLSKGPTENGHRPAVNTLFRSAALAKGPAVIGVVLSGALDDGTAGMVAIKQRGGTTVVQDPDDAIYPGMPESVLQHVAVDHVLPVVRIGPLLARLAGQHADTIAAGPASDTLRTEVAVSQDDSGAAHGDIPRIGSPTTLTCPDCAGSLVEIPGDSAQYRCLVGHAWTADALMDAYGVSLERAMWTALRTLDEKASLAHRMVDVSKNAGRGLVAERYVRQEEEALAAADVLRKYLLRGDVREETGT
ncbi:chemotaxis protein CheB [Lentzea flava]|uniref:protein-glutamate methylesterase n=1 Tax=Lentzea flava TaxID=103732 RepID=A0ABQ2UIZ8_9PSEU|nr:chemotaxis protein CheB [Lentzea flava]MCP2199219.1 two-component system, chemotaxis family, response regulator CheB [Lentzea flava]GGU33687.1 chemotaxis protein CheB [Lentzea flava]